MIYPAAGVAGWSKTDILNNVPNVKGMPRVSATRCSERCLQWLERMEQNPRCSCEIELYKDFAPYSFLFKERRRWTGLSWTAGLITLLY